MLLLVSGPSGSGKTTLCRRLANEGEARYSISCTTRPPRAGEQNAIDYYFLTKDDFQKRRNNNEFLETAEVHGNYYGTLKSEVGKYLENGSDVVMDLDFQGAQQVRHCPAAEIRNALVDVFIMPESEEELRDRLSNRNTDTPEAIALRMKNALEEISQWPEYTYRLLSQSQEADYARFLSIVTAERLKVSRARTRNATAPT